MTIHGWLVTNQRTKSTGHASTRFHFVRDVRATASGFDGEHLYGRSATVAKDGLDVLGREVSTSDGEVDSEV